MHKFMTKPFRVLVKRDELALENIKQFCVPTQKDKDKLQAMVDLLGHDASGLPIIAQDMTITFCNSSKQVELLSQHMHNSGVQVTSYHESIPQKERDAIMQRFRSGQIRHLISTDLLSRGLDAQHISAVISYELPINREGYIHRIGRTAASAGKVLQSAL